MALSAWFSGFVMADDVDEPVAADAPACVRPGSEKAIATEQGSAGFMKNLAEHPESIRAIAKTLLSSALDGTVVKMAPACPGACDNTPINEVVYRVAPIQFLPQDEQNAECLAFERDTRDNPLRFGPREFASVEAINEWIMAFSQGRGDDGSDLYERCSSNCSPRYTFLIAALDEGYSLRAEVQCGLARDRGNDQYLISTALRRVCALD